MQVELIAITRHYLSTSNTASAIDCEHKMLFNVTDEAQNLLTIIFQNNKSFKCEIHIMHVITRCGQALGFLHSRTNLSPFTKDFRGEVQLNEYLTYFSQLPSGDALTYTKRISWFTHEVRCFDVLHLWDSLSYPLEAIVLVQMSL